MSKRTVLVFSFHFGIFRIGFFMSGDCFNLAKVDVEFCRSFDFDLLVLIIVKSLIIVAN